MSTGEGRQVQPHLVQLLLRLLLVLVLVGLPVAGWHVPSVAASVAVV